MAVKSCLCFFFWLFELKFSMLFDVALGCFLMFHRGCSLPWSVIGSRMFSRYIGNAKTEQ